MKKQFVGAATAVGMAAAGLVGVATQASATTIGSGDGEAIVYLPQCSKDKAQSLDLVPDCTFSAFSKKSDGKAEYTYLSSPSYVLWNKGTITSRALTFPAASQTWPQLKLLGGAATNTAQPQEITGTIDASGKVDLTINYKTTIAAGPLKCELSGTTTLSSDATDPMGGVAKGAAYDPATSRFAAASTTVSKPTTTGPACSTVGSLYDLSKGMSWFVSGYMIIPGGAAPEIPNPEDPANPEPTVMVQEAAVNTPKKIKAKGKTVILKKAVTTNAGQKATSKVTWSPKKNANGAKQKFASVKTSKAGKITITTTGKAKRLFVKLVTNAPATGDYQPFTYTKRWIVK